MDNVKHKAAGGDIKVHTAECKHVITYICKVEVVTDLIIFNC